MSIVVVVVVLVVSLLLCGANEVENDGGHVGSSVDDVTRFADLVGAAEVVEAGREGDAVLNGHMVASVVRLVRLEVSRRTLQYLLAVHVVNVPVEGWCGDSPEGSACSLDPGAALGQAVGNGGGGLSSHIWLCDDWLRLVRYEHFSLVCHCDKIVCRVGDDSTGPVAASQFRVCGIHSQYASTSRITD